MASFMKFKGFLLAGILACAAHLASAQDGGSSDFLITPPPSSPPEFLLVLRTDNKTVIVDPETHDMVAYESAVDAAWVQSIEMISGDEGESRYGAKGKNGVIIIQFKPNYVLPLTLPEAVRSGK